MRDILYSLNQRIPDQQPISRQFLNDKSTSSMRTKRSGMEICQEIIRRDESRSVEKTVEEEEPSQPMTMMF